MPLTYQPFEESPLLDKISTQLPAPKPAINVGENERLVSLVGGVALAVAGLSRRSVGGLLAALLGGALIYRGKTGHCHVLAQLGKNTAEKDSSHHRGIKVEKMVTIGRSAAELFAYWRQFDNLPKFMSHVESVEVLSAKRSHWTVKGPLGKTVEWDAEIVNEHPNEMIAWSSMPGADVQNAGSVRFIPTPSGLETEVRVLLEFHPPAGPLGALVAKLFGESPEQQVANDLAEFKNLMEAEMSALAV